MYKTKLQEVCHKRQWGLPKYSTMKDGPDHTPSFKSSVIVNGISFDSPFPSNSSKQSQDSVAKLALLHFTSQSPNSAVSGESDSKETCEIHSHNLPVKEDVQCEYKSQLHNYAHWKNFDLPIYTSTSEGPSDALRFKARVTVAGHAFDSPRFFTTLKEAENAAAKAAFMSMMADDSQEENSGFYKNSLQELAQKEDLSAPVYRTINTGAPHMPTFFSLVEIEGERFYGKAGKTKKAAEVKAAKVAYTFLKSVAMSRSTESCSAAPVTDESLECNLGSDLATIVDLQPNEQHDDEFLSSPVILHQEHFAEDKVQQVNPIELTANLQICSEDSMLPHPSTGHQRLSSHFCENTSTLIDEDSTNDSNSNSPLLSSYTNTGMAETPGSYLLCERVSVYSSYPNIAFPKGITVLPIAESKWVAVSLEFPNEQVC